jgi:hypothetical protein
MEVLIPTGTPRGAKAGKALSVANLAGKRIGIVSNGWRSMEAMMPQMAELVKQRWHASTVSFFHVHINKAITPQELGRLVSDCDVAIVGIAN